MHDAGLSICKLGTLRISSKSNEYKCLNTNGDSEGTVTAIPALKTFVKKYADSSACGYIVHLLTKRDSEIKGRSRVRYYEAIVRNHLHPLFAQLAALLSYPGNLTLAAAM